MPEIKIKNKIEKLIEKDNEIKKVFQKLSMVKTELLDQTIEKLLDSLKARF